jgi:hypothetical protein
MSDDEMEAQMESGATIQAVETGDETLYVLRRPGMDPISAYWPHPLYALEPNALRLPMNDHHPGPRHSIPVPPSYHRSEPKLPGRPASRTTDHDPEALASPRNRGKEQPSMGCRESLEGAA